MRILLATDAWTPQINGVVRTYQRLAHELKSIGVELVVLGPENFRCVPCPSYPEIGLALPDQRHCSRLIDEAKVNAIHIATEGPVGWMARRHCRHRGIPFTTSFHTRFADYVSARWPIPESWVYAIQRRFHSRSAGVMVATESLASDLRRRGFERLMPWTRGVDTELFRPQSVRLFGDGPVFLYAGRVAVEKNIEAFLRLDLPGVKVVVGDGPQLAELEATYPDVTFTGVREGADLAACYASADVFVFPSVTDTFGMVMLEAMACGVPVAAFPVIGPKDLVTTGVSGVLGKDLKEAALAAYQLDRARVREAALAFTWPTAAALFLTNIESALGPVRQRSESRSRELKMSRARPV
ncbi:glycosyltransferase family 1 protein [Hyphomicrobium sp.]|uniref:glycosyltransferase family 4 protein n=1 Tax=Hyphomicrobium sp. TaxID=82 RepID=UPI002E30E433|nr:glycosyltransferase family 1 protein [Hyphomicrobium sp.]HEX2841525.1 glycosyltransferase family 1 protein [Hyphomicrobium sp.]